MSTNSEPQYGTEAYCERYAGLVHNIGTMLRDRRDGLTPEEDARMWAYLGDELDGIYETVNRYVTDRIEDELWPEEEA